MIVIIIRVFIIFVSINRTIIIVGITIIGILIRMNCVTIIVSVQIIFTSFLSSPSSWL